MEGDAQSSPAGEGSADACTSDVYGKESTDRAEGLQAGGSPRDEVGLHTPSVEVVQNIYANETSYAEQQRQAARQFRQIAREVMA